MPYGDGTAVDIQPVPIDCARRIAFLAFFPGGHVGQHLSGEGKFLPLNGFRLKLVPFA